jgi:hypothetical protein
VPRTGQLIVPGRVRRVLPNPGRGEPRWRPWRGRVRPGLAGVRHHLGRLALLRRFPACQRRTWPPETSRTLWPSWEL